MNKLFTFLLVSFLVDLPARAQNHASPYRLPVSVYEDRVHAVWLAQIAGTLLAWPHEHSVASVEWLDKYPTPRTHAPVDDDWYYEMIAIDAFEKYGPDLSVEQLGRQWQEVNAGTWGSSEQARLLMAKGVNPAQAGHPRYNKLWYSIGPQFSADIYGVLAPGMPDLAGKIARDLCHINGYAEGADGGVFIAGMVSLAFVEKDPKQIVKKAASLLHPSSPYRQCLDLVISMAEKGYAATEIVNAVEDKWHFEYPATNNGVANGGIVAVSVWFGKGDFLQTVNLAAAAADFTDADCNAANAASVIGAMHGTKAIPSHLISALNDRIKGDSMGELKLTPAVDLQISTLARRTAAVGKSILQKNGIVFKGDNIEIPVRLPATQAPELFRLADLMTFWNPEWKLERAGFGGAGGGMRGIRGITYLDSNILITYPRDEVRGLFLHRTIKPDGRKQLSFSAGSEAKKAWHLSVYVGNRRVLSKLIAGSDTAFKWENIKLNLEEFAGQTVKIRIYQRVLLPGREAGNAFWKDLDLLEVDKKID